MIDSNDAAECSHSGKAENREMATESAGVTVGSSAWSGLVKPLSGVITLCMLCCAIPYILLFTGIVGASTAAYLSGKVEIAIGVIVLASMVFVFFRRQSRNSKKLAEHENIGSIKDAGRTSINNQVLRKEGHHT